ncbi:unnamed protein product [Cyclocybe aegerita]|uniref:Uncharacterized protein n=1 Tax=Cyclocybe aegerita TaxID=1973307 RepID=A0A8S0XVV9_CYCAE|nr:unnamed protein product [Cyclocybe aegerita]
MTGEKSMGIDFTAFLLHLLGFDDPDRIIHRRKELQFEMCASNVGARIDVCVEGRSRECIFLVQHATNTMIDPEPQLIAGAIAAFTQTSLGRIASGLPPLREKVIPGVTMCGTTPTFFTIPITLELVDGVASGIRPERVTVVHRCVPPVARPATAPAVIFQIPIMTSVTHLFPAFPPEISSIIVEFAEERPALCALALSCSFLRAEAQRVLFRAVSDDYDGTTHYHFLSTLIEYPHLGGLVLEYAGHSIAHTQPGSFPDILRRALPLMGNLQDLAFTHEGAFPDDPEEVLPPGLPFQLTGFTWAHEFGEAHVWHFVQMQTKLESLEWYPTKVWGAPPHYPDLRFLKGNCFTVQMFLPGHSIEDLRFSLEDEPTEEPDARLLPGNDIDSVAEELGQVTRFELTDSVLAAGRGSESQALLKHLTSVRILDVVPLYEGDLEVIRRLPNLEILVLTLDDDEDIELPVWSCPLETDRNATINTLFSTCHTLKCLYITKSALNVSDESCEEYEIWIEGKKQSKTLSHDQVDDILCDYPDVELCPA